MTRLPQKPRLEWKQVRGKMVPRYRMTWTEGGKRRERTITLDWKGDPAELDRLYWLAAAGKHPAQLPPAPAMCWRNLIVAWRSDPRVQRRLSAATKASYRRTMDQILEKNGDRDVRHTTRQHVRAVHDKHAATPRKADHMVQVIRLLWNFAKDNGDPEPMIALAPTYKPPREQSPRLCCITLTDGWKWSRTHNDDDQVVFELADNVRVSGDQWQREMAGYFAAVLGLNSVDPGTIRRVRGIIEDSLQELATMGIAPEREALFDDHGMQVEIVDHSTGATHSAPLKVQ